MDKNALVKVSQICGRKQVEIEGEIKPAVPGLVNVSPATWFRWVKEGVVPKPIKKGRSSYWRYCDVVELGDK